MHYTVYKITNLKNLKIYIGCHITNKVNDTYMGSGKLIKLAIKKYGLKTFDKEILYDFSNREEMLLKEVELISTLKPEYNLHEGGKGGWSSYNMNIKDYSVLTNTEEGNLKISKSLKKFYSENPEHKNRIVKNLNDKIRERYKNGTLVGSFKGKNHSEEFKKKIGVVLSNANKGEGNSNYGKKWIYNEEMQKSISVNKTEIDQYISSGWKIGRKIKW